VQNCLFLSDRKTPDATALMAWFVRFDLKKLIIKIV
jgi:hypothetical protein